MRTFTQLHKYALATVIMISVFLFAVGCTPFTSTINNTTILDKKIVTIGVLLPLSGDLARIGMSQQHAIELALLHLNESFPQQKFRYQTIIEDNKLDPKLSATIAHKLIDVDTVDAIMTFSSGVGNTVSPIADAEKIIHFGIASDPHVSLGPYNFVHGTPPDEEARKWITEAEKRGIKTIQVFGMQQDGVLAIIAATKKRMIDTPLQIIDEQTFITGEKDFRTIILKSKAYEADALLLISLSPELELLTRQLREMNITTPITSIEAIGESDQLHLFEGSWYADAAETKDYFTTLYTQTFQETPGFGAPHMYDTTNMIVYGFEHADSKEDQKPTREQVAETLSHLENFTGALGTLHAMDDGIIWSGATIREIQKGKVVDIG